MSKINSTSRVSIELPADIIDKVYDDVRRRMTTQPIESGTFEIEGIIIIPNVVSIFAVAKEMDDVQFFDNQLVPSTMARLIISYQAFYPNL